MSHPARGGHLGLYSSTSSPTPTPSPTPSETNPTPDPQAAAMDAVGVPDSVQKVIPTAGKVIDKVKDVAGSLVGSGTAPIARTNRQPLVRGKNTSAPVT